MGNLQHQRGRFCRSDFNLQTRRLLLEAYHHEMEIFYDMSQEWLREDEEEQGDSYGQESWFLSLADVTSLWYGTVCQCGHGPESHDAETRFCVDPDCTTCHEGYLTSDDDDDLLTRTAGEGYRGNGAYHSGGRPDIWDRYDDMYDP